MTQSQIPNNHGNSTPPSKETWRLTLSAPVPSDENAPKLVSGSGTRQVFSNNEYIFSVTPSFDKLYRRRFHREGISNEVDQTLAFERVQSVDHSNFLRNGTYKHKKLEGKATSYDNIYYDVYAFNLVVDNKHYYGYRMIAQKKFSFQDFFNYKKKIFPFQDIFYYKEKGR